MVSIQRVEPNVEDMPILSSDPTTVTLIGPSSSLELTSSNIIINKEISSDGDVLTSNGDGTISWKSISNTSPKLQDVINSGSDSNLGFKIQQETTNVFSKTNYGVDGINSVYYNEEGVIVYSSSYGSPGLSINTDDVTTKGSSNEVNSDSILINNKDLTDSDPNNHINKQVSINTNTINVANIKNNEVCSLDESQLQLTYNNSLMTQYKRNEISTSESFSLSIIGDLTVTTTSNLNPCTTTISSEAIELGTESSMVTINNDVTIGGNAYMEGTNIIINGNTGTIGQVLGNNEYGNIDWIDVFSGPTGPTGPPGILISGNNNIYIGTTGNVDDNNVVRIGNDDTTSYYIGDITTSSVYNNGWVQMYQDINIENRGTIGSLFSVSLSSDGTIVAIGAPFSNSVKGKCRIYKLGLTGSDPGSTGWVQMYQDINGIIGTEELELGYSVSLSENGSIVAIGSLFSNSGKCYIYQLGLTGGTGTTGWIQMYQDINGKTDEQSGRSVSLSSDGTIVAIGGPISNSFTGICRIYKLGLTGSDPGSTGWVQMYQDINGNPNDQLGYSVSLSSKGTSVAIGAPNNSKCYIYQLGLTGGTGTTGWIQLYQDINGNSSSGSGFSVSLSSDGTIVAIGSPYNNSNRGQCRIYKLGLTGSSPGSTGWVQMYQDIDGKSDEYTLGYSVSLSSNGTILAIGANINNSTKGRCYIYQLGLTGGTGTTGWVQLNEYIDGRDIGDLFGQIISLSSNGTTVAISTPRTDSGQCRVFSSGLEKSSLVTVNDTLKMTNGFYFGQGNLNSNGYIFQSGSTGSLSLNGNTGTTGSFTFNTPFVSVPTVMISANTTNSYISVCTSNILTTGFTWKSYNNTSTSSGAYSVSYLAIGQI